MTVLLQFCGAAGTVTGSCYWLRHPQGQFLVDCGLFQGSKTLRELNYGDFPFDPAALDFVLLTHAHMDHAGLVPKLCNRGFAGRVLATAGSRDLLTYMLPDAGYIQETEVGRLNRRNAQRGRPPVSPIYTKKDAEACLARIAPVPYEEWFEAGPGVRARLWNAGHILGSASVEVEIATGEREKRLLRLLFSGDLGPGSKAFHPEPAAPENHDYLVVESTYGDVERPDLTPETRRACLGTELRAALERGGNLLIPAFAVERTQELLYDLGELFRRGEAPPAQVFLDSPLAVRATEVFAAHAGELEGAAAEAAGAFRAANVRFLIEREDSRALDRVTKGAIIIAASGMCDFGRIRHHLAANLWRPEATVLLVGYQAPGTLGSLLEKGAPSVRIQGEDIRVRARVRILDVYSGHADRGGLVAWVRERLPVRGGVFLTHGEEEGLSGLKDALVDAGCAEEQLFIARLDEVAELSARGAPRTRPAVARPRLALPALARRDWHNEHADFLLDFERRLQELADDRGRRALIRRLKQALAEGG